MRRISTAMLAILGTVLLSTIPLAAAQDGFPEYAEIEYEQSVITIPLFVEGFDEPVEILKLDAYMKLVRDEPTRNGLGYRQFEFTIADWELVGYSELLDAWVSFALSDTVQPNSLGIALQKESDYPAMIVYSAIYDIYLDGKRIVKDQPGVAFAKNVFEIPPRNITVAFQKPFEGSLPVNREYLERIGSERGGKKGAALFETQEEAPEVTVFWDPGTCEDMETIPEQTYEEGMKRGRAIRAGEYLERPITSGGQGNAEK